MIDLTAYPAIATLVERQLQAWPEHRRYVETSFAAREADILRASERIAAFILKLAPSIGGGLDQMISDYRFMSEKLVLPEEIYFRRHHRYRLSSFEAAYAEYYSNRELMTRYMNGVLLSNLFWENHTRAVAHLTNRLLPSLPRDANHLEIGPGHGMMLTFAAEQPGVANVTGWDVSEASLEATRAALRCIGLERRVTLRPGNLIGEKSDSDFGRFDCIVLGEILEHIEDPKGALQTLRPLLRSGGLVWINVPVNSPAPDHIYLLRTPEEACDLVASAGFEIVESVFLPMTGATLERARRQELTISCVILGRLP